MRACVPALLLATGCSWMTMTRPAPAAAHAEPCEVRGAPPIVDGVGAAALAALSVGAIAGTTSSDAHNAAIVLVAVPAAILATLAVASALDGAEINRACRAAR